MRTQVAIIGSGPSGLLLGQLLGKAGIDNVILDRSAKAHILARVRAGVLEQGTVSVLDRAATSGRLHAEALLHDGFSLAFDGRDHRIDLNGLTGGQACHRLRSNRGHTRPDRCPGSPRPGKPL
jgi:p-hydroxybenzoate 3-monooxygenase